MTAVLVETVADTQQRVWFPSYCAVCEQPGWFKTLRERRLWEDKHQHGGMD